MKYKIGNIVQINPKKIKNQFSGCFGVVDKIISCGYKIYISIPLHDITEVNLVYLKLNRKAVTKIGKAKWVEE